MEWFIFKAADEHLGIEVGNIYRVVEDPAITPVPLMPSCHMGLTYYRGEIFDVIDIVRLLKEKRATPAGRARAILLKWSGKNLALVPDGVSGLLWVGEGKDTGTVYSEGEYVVRLVTPEQIWDQLSGLSYGHPEIPEDLHPGIEKIP
ncbi:MAG: hypothetical protein DRH56_02335 [Deltaproteobacteria bacterium]|nr:MAG: hypothetical protein DRH56_02335 [Deltaproteobacteria bacterium]